MLEIFILFIVFIFGFSIGGIITSLVSKIKDKNLKISIYIALITFCVIVSYVIC